MARFGIRDVEPLIMLPDMYSPFLYNILCTVNTQLTSKQDAIITVRPI